MPLKTPVPQWPDLDTEQRRAATAFHRYLTDTDYPIDIQSPDFYAQLLFPDAKVLDANQATIADFFAPFIAQFEDNILYRGLLSAVSGETSTVMSSDMDGVGISTLTIAGRILTTISEGSLAAGDYRQISFICTDTGDVEGFNKTGVQACCGKYYQLEELLTKAAGRFGSGHDIASVMQANEISMAFEGDDPDRPSFMCLGKKRTDPPRP